MGKAVTLRITATEENWAHGAEADVKEALADLGITLEELLSKFGEEGFMVSIMGEDIVWNEGTEDETIAEPNLYNFTIKEVSDGY